MTVESRTLPRITRNCQLGRLVTTGPLPGSEIYVAGGKSREIELSAISDSGLAEIDWNIEQIPRLSSKGTRRALVSNFNDLYIDSVPIAIPESLGERWNSGPNENSRWHPEGAVSDSGFHFRREVTQPHCLENLCSARLINCDYSRPIERTSISPTPSFADISDSNSSVIPPVVHNIHLDKF